MALSSRRRVTPPKRNSASRLPDAPPGVKGISLFVVPKLRPEGKELIGNDLFCTQVYHKMGYRGTPLTELAIGDHGDCRGFLVGEPHRQGQLSGRKVVRPRAQPKPLQRQIDRIGPVGQGDFELFQIPGRC